MNRDVIETQWPQVREILIEKFNHLTEDDIREINGRYDQLVLKLQQKYGYSREEAEDRIRLWNFDRKLAANERIVREEVRNEEESGSAFKWLAAICIPLLLLGLLFFNIATPPQPANPAAVQEQTVKQTPGDVVIMTSLRNALTAKKIPNFDVQNVQITSREGIVTLSGSVPNAEVRDSVVNTSQNFTGVKRVIDNLQIK